MAGLDEVVIISGCRTPVGKFQGSLSELSATQLGALNGPPERALDGQVSVITRTP